MTRSLLLACLWATACADPKAQPCGEHGVARMTVTAENPEDLSVEYRIQSIVATNCGGESVSADWSDEIVTPFIGDVTLLVTGTWVNAESGWGTAAQTCTGSRTVRLTADEELAVTVQVTDCSMQYAGM